ncbi:hypothetical protein CQY20_24335 [Mycolicibacterium agri]|uniref:Intersectin-EH binding protein Ibp1 n=1 Tax=Mycolicibacterium agri TaxID=36811 RepID=A0A2A7MSQ0_MYCAG|nr:hypothetical protein [Mycolicibacterium agri]PEG34745.1 hypothetical protein CQY20_24335 [Mycolicibacterium agri]GFG50434.1 hypothetical protein MAGR_18750 [Mycolicibacterium agri]
MNTSTRTHAIGSRAPKLLSAGLSSAAVAFGFTAFVASAAPLVWDIEAYDECMGKTVRDANQCCVDSGGVPTDEPLEDGKGQKCSSPPAELSVGDPQPVPGPKLPPGVVLAPGSLPTAVGTG